MTFTCDTWTLAKVSFLVLLSLRRTLAAKLSCSRKISHHLLQATCSHNISRVYQTVKMSSGLFYLFSHLLVAVQVKNICNQVERILIILYLSVQICKIESIGKVVFVDVAKVFVAARRDELVQIKMLANLQIIRRLKEPQASLRNSSRLFTILRRGRRCSEQHSRLA